MSYTKLAKSVSSASSSIDPNDFIKELRKLHRETKILDPVHNRKPSPYLRDQANFDKGIIKDSQSEYKWRHVTESREEDIENILASELAKKRLNII